MTFYAELLCHDDVVLPCRRSTSIAARHARGQIDGVIQMVADGT